MDHRDSTVFAEVRNYFNSALIFNMEELSKRILKLREYLKNASQEELDDRMARVKAMNLPKGPTVSDYMKFINHESEKASN